MKRKVLAVEISSLDDEDYTYVACDRNSCRDEFDNALFQDVMTHCECVGMGVSRGFYSGKLVEIDIPAK